MTYYISGPMSGIADLNQPSFAMAANHIHLRGHHVITPFDSPAAVHLPDTYRKQLRRDLVAICGKADALYMLDGWEHSPGARAEHAVGVALQLPIVYEGDV